MFVGYPFGSILYHAFTRWDGIAPAQWVGLHNFKVLWHDPLFLHSLRNNALFAGLSAGMGLGLSFVTVILAHHGATLAIDSAPLQGATFRVSFPRA